MASLGDRLREVRPVRVATLVVLAVLLAAAVLGWHPRLRYAALIGAGLAGLVLVWKPALGLGALILFALVVPLQFGTGTEVRLNPTALIVPALAAVWAAGALIRRDLPLVRTGADRPLLLFLLSAALSLLIGNALWDLAVPRPANLLVVQLAQWGILVSSGAAFWLMGSLVTSPEVLRRLTWLFLYVGGAVAVLRALPGLGRLAEATTTSASTRAPFWMLLAALGGGQLFFNRDLRPLQRGYLVCLLGLVAYFAFVVRKETASNWIGVAVAVAALAWLRFPRLRAVVVVALLVLYPVLAPRVYEFGGGDSEWEESGGSRLALINRVISVTRRDPLFGVGPASYRVYASAEPLTYGGALWYNPAVNSHNNYVDLYAHVGLVGLGLFAWFVWEVLRLGGGLVGRVGAGFVAGYTHGAVAALVAALVLMMLADWVLPFVYNIGFPGFQASVLVWLFLGGLAAVARWYPSARGT